MLLAVSVVLKKSWWTLAIPLRLQLFERNRPDDGYDPFQETDLKVWAGRF